MKIREISAKQILVKSNLPASDYVANPYTGCSHQCRYCYASFMKRFSGHSEEWGTFLDVKSYESDRLPKKLRNKTILLSSVTDPYQGCEARFHKSREILELLQNTEADIEILSKSDLMLKDLELLKSIKRLKVGISLCTLDDSFRKLIEPGAPSVKRRLNALKTLHESGISTYLFISPVFPYLTDIPALVQAVDGSVDKIGFENLNLRGTAKTQVLDLIKQHYPQYSAGYEQIYLRKDDSYWKTLETEIQKLSENYQIPFENYFYHEKIRKNGGQKHD